MPVITALETYDVRFPTSRQLDGSDALLAKGDSVTIRRAALGSYFLTTPAGREHRVKRVR